MIELDPVDGEAVTLRQTYACFPSGVVAVCATVDGTPMGMAVSSFTAVSVAPPLVSFCVQNTSETWPRLRRLPRLGISVLAEWHGSECMSLSRKTGDRFLGIDWEATQGGSVLIRGATAWFDCSIHAEVAAGDHSITVLRIHGSSTTSDIPPLVFHGSRFRRLAAVGGPADQGAGR